MTTSAPSLLNAEQISRNAGNHSSVPHSLVDLMYDGFYAIFLLKNRCAPEDEATFSEKIKRFLDDFDRQAKKMDIHADDVHAAKYAYCAAIDEMVLRSQFSIRHDWERRPLQLILFGDQLAGENFFHRLEELRTSGSAHIQALEVFHMCLLLGFEGKYILEGTEKLNYLTARLGDEIAHMKGKTAGFAPHWARPDQIINKLRNDVPLWIIFSVFGLMGLLAFWGLNSSLTHNTTLRLNAYNDVVKMAPKAANITIILP